MPDQLAALGISASSREERESQIRLILSEAKPHSKRDGNLTLRWQDASGAELWIYVDESGHLASVQPHFTGGHCLSLEIQVMVARPEVSAFDGGFVSWSGPGSVEQSAGGMPVVFDVPDFIDAKVLALPIRRDVELVGFAVEVEAYSSEEELREVQPDLKPLPLPAFIPAGLIGAMEGVQPTAHALIVGRLLLAERVKNELTGGEFIRLRVETPADPLDIVAEPGLVPELPEEGDVVQVGAWISGRVLPAAKMA